MMQYHSSVFRFNTFTSQRPQLIYMYIKLYNNYFNLKLSLMTIMNVRELLSRSNYPGGYYNIISLLRYLYAI